MLAKVGVINIFSPKKQQQQARGYRFYKLVKFSIKVPAIYVN